MRKEKIQFLNNCKPMLDSYRDARDDALDTDDAKDTSDTCLLWINHQPSLSIFNINLLTLLKDWVWMIILNKPLQVICSLTVLFQSFSSHPQPEMPHRTMC